MLAKIYSPAEVDQRKVVIAGDPDPDHISTSLIERQNLTMRMSIRRFTRRTNGFSKKLLNHAYSVALHFMYYTVLLIVCPNVVGGLSPPSESGELYQSLGVFPVGLQGLGQGLVQRIDGGTDWIPWLVRLQTSARPDSTRDYRAVRTGAVYAPAIPWFGCDDCRPDP